MKKLFRQYAKAVTKFVTTSYAPFIVWNAATGGTHFAWTRKEALAWLACYDADDMGRTEVLNFLGNTIAAKF